MEKSHDRTKGWKSSPRSLVRRIVKLQKYTRLWELPPTFAMFCKLKMSQCIKIVFFTLKTGGWWFNLEKQIAMVVWIAWIFIHSMEIKWRMAFIRLSLCPGTIFSLLFPSVFLKEREREKNEKYLFSERLVIYPLKSKNDCVRFCHDYIKVFSCFVFLSFF